METRTCGRCGREYERQPHDDTRDWRRRRFCSRSCATTTRELGRKIPGFAAPGEFFGVNSKLIHGLSANDLFALSRSLARRMGFSESEVDDASGEALLESCRAMIEYDPSRGVKFSTYATAAMKTRLLNYRREVSRRTASVFLVDEEEIIPDVVFVDTKTRTPDLIAQDREAASLAKSALSRLPDGHRDLIVRSVMGGQSDGEVARSIGCSREWARQKIRHAVRLLRGELGAVA